MAESLGSVVLGIQVDQTQLSAGLDAAQRLARQKGEQIQSALTARQQRVSTLDSQILSLQRQQIGADQSRAALIGQRISILRQETAEQRAGIAVLREKLAVQNQIVASAAREAATSGGGAFDILSALPFAGAGALAGGPAGLATASAAALAAGLSAISVAGIQANNEIQRLNQSLLVLTGSQRVTDAIVASLRQYALLTPFDTPELAATTKQLIAYGLSARDAVDLTRRLGDVATVTASDLDGIALNLGQIISQGRTYETDLRQFAQRGIPIYETLSEVTGKAVAELKGLDGGIPADKVVEAFRKMTDAGGKFFKGGERAGTAYNRELATLQESIKLTQAEFGKIITPAAVASFKGLSEVISGTGRALGIVNEQANRLQQNPFFAKLIEGGTKLALTLFTPSQLAILQQVLKLVPQGKPDTPGEVPETNEAERRLKAFKDADKERQRSAKEVLEPLKLQEEASRRVVGLEGAAREAAVRRLEFERLRADQKKRELEYIKAAATFNKDQNSVTNYKLAGEAAIKLAAAAARIRIAIVEGIDQAASRLRAARQSFEDAQRRQDSARLSAFGLIPFAAQQSLRTNLTGQIQTAFNRGQLDAGALFQRGIGFDANNTLDTSRLSIQQLSEIASQGQALVDAADPLGKAATELRAAAAEFKAYAEAGAKINVTVPVGAVVESNAPQLQTTFR